MSSQCEADPVRALLFIIFHMILHCSQHSALSGMCRTLYEPALPPGQADSAPVSPFTRHTAFLAIPRQASLLRVTGPLHLLLCPRALCLVWTTHSKGVPLHLDSQSRTLLTAFIMFIRSFTSLYIYLLMSLLADSSTSM